MLEGSTKIENFKTETDASYKIARRLAIANGVHYNNGSPEVLLKERQPIESTVDAALDYRKKNYRNETASLFKRSLDIIVEALIHSKSDVTIKDDNTQKFLDTYRFIHNKKVYNIREYIYDALVQVKAYDPMAIVVCIPKNVGKKLLLGKKFQEINREENVDVEIRLFKSYEILKADYEAVVLKLGVWDHEDNSKPNHDCYLRMYQNEDGKFQQDIIYRDSTDYYAIPYYEIDSKVMPFVILGSNSNVDIDNIKNTEINYFASDFFGALQIADTYIGDKSDLQVMTARSHPIKFMLDQECDAGCQHHAELNYYGFQAGEEFKRCQKCGGSGKLITDTSPFTTVTVKPKGGLDLTNTELKSPVGFATPPHEIINVHREISRETYERVANELCIDLIQNITNASEGSKRFDLTNKITLYGNYCNDMVRIWTQLYHIVNYFMNKGQSEVVVKKPMTWDVKSKNDILFQLTEAKKNKAPLYYIQELNKELLSKTLGLDIEHEAINFIIKTDKLLPYSLEDLNTAKGIYGEDLTQQSIVIHDNIIPIITTILKEQEYNLEKKFQELIKPILDAIKPKVIE